MHDIVVDGVISDKPKEEIINIYNKLLPHKDKVYSIINSVQADELEVPYEAYEKLYNILSGGSDSKEEINKLLSKYKKDGIK